MFDVTKIEKEAREELNEELSKNAKSKLKAKLREIATAERVLLNLRGELEVLKRDIASEAALDAA